MNSTFIRIDHLSKVLQGLTPMKDECQQRLDKKLRLDFSYNSNHLEGNTLTYGETQLLLIFGETKGGHSYREYAEMKAHDVAFALIKEWAADDDQPLTEAGIKNLNAIILVEPFWKEALTAEGVATKRKIKIGAYKEYPNSVMLQNGEIFNYTSPEDTPSQMGELIQWYRQQEDEKKLHPAELAAMLHYKFVRIHPFDDGNGRISRLLMNYVLVKNGLPPVIVKSIDKKSYLQALHLADSGDIDAFIDYIGEQVEWSLNVSIKAAKGESIDEPGDLDKKLGMLKRKFGTEANEKVQIKYNLEVFERFVTESIMPFLETWENKLKEFDSLFCSRKNVISVGSRQRLGASLELIFPGLWDDYKRYDMPTHGVASAVAFSCTFEGLRYASNKTIKISGGQVQLTFYENMYEIHFLANQKPITRLYHQHITVDDIDLIIEGLGHSLLEEVEKLLVEVV